MTKTRKLKFGVQIVALAITAVAVANIPLLTPRPSPRWIEMAALAAFSLGVFCGVGFGHFYPGDGEEF